MVKIHAFITGLCYFWLFSVAVVYCLAGWWFFWKGVFSFPFCGEVVGLGFFVWLVHYVVVVIWSGVFLFGLGFHLFFLCLFSQCFTLPIF